MRLIREGHFSRSRDGNGRASEALQGRLPQPSGGPNVPAKSGKPSSIMRSTPDLVLCDINMPHMNGFEVLERLNEIAPRLDTYRSFFSLPLLEIANSAGGSSVPTIMLASHRFERLHLIIEARLGNVARTRVASQLVRLKDREIEILTLAARGKTSAEMAVKLGLSKRTVDFHISPADR